MSESRSSSPVPPNVRRVGLIAGWGRYPVVLARALKKEGYEVVCLGARDHADPALADICDVYAEKGMGKFGWATKFFRKHGVEYATLAGKIHKIKLFDPWFIWRQAPDFYTVRFFAAHFLRRRSDNKDDSLLSTVCRAFENRGVTMLPGTVFAPELLVERKLLTKRAPSASQWQDVFFGWKLARDMGRLDVGQSVSKSKKFVVVKVAKPQQDMRFDVPTVGMGTLKTMAESGAAVLAVEAKRTLFIDKEETVAYADAHNISIVALIEEDVDNPATEAEFEAQSVGRLVPGVASSTNAE